MNCFLLLSVHSISVQDTLWWLRFPSCPWNVHCWCCFLVCVPCIFSQVQLFMIPQDWPRVIATGWHLIIVKGNGSNERNGQFYFAGTSLLPTPISYSKYSSPNVFCAVSFITKCQELINPAVLLNVSKVYFCIFIHRILPITSKYLHCPFQI